MTLPGFTAEKALDFHMTLDLNAASSGGRQFRSPRNVVCPALWSEGGDDENTDSSDGFQGFGDPAGYDSGDALGDDSGPGDSWIWPQGGCIYRCTRVGQDYHCEPIVCMA